MNHPSFSDPSDSPKKPPQTYRDYLLVGGLLSLIMIANIAIINSFKDVQSNYWTVPGVGSEFYGQRILVLALEIQFNDTNYAVDIRSSTNDVVYLNTIQFWKVENGKYLHYTNLSQWTTWDPTETYRAMWWFRSWYSPRFMVNETAIIFIEDH